MPNAASAREMFSQHIFCSKFNNDVHNRNTPRAFRPTTDAKQNSHCVYLQPVVSTRTHSLTIIIIYNRSCAWLNQSLPLPAPKRRRFEPRPVLVGFVVDKAAGARFSSEHIGLPPSNLTPHLFLSLMLYKAYHLCYIKLITYVI